VNTAVRFYRSVEMNINDYLIDHQNFDWTAILADWHWLLPAEFCVWLMNKYGDLVLVVDENAILFFDVGNGTIEQVADSKEDFSEKLDADDNANLWLMIPLVDQLATTGLKLNEGRCYSFLTPPILGGEYNVENTVTLPITEHYSVYASIQNQIKDLPDGTRVVIKVKT
jgi:hypothetical protein